MTTLATTTREFCEAARRLAQHPVDKLRVYTEMRVAREELDRQMIELHREFVAAETGAHS